MNIYCFNLKSSDIQDVLERERLKPKRLVKKPLQLYVAQSSEYLKGTDSLGIAKNWWRRKTLVEYWLMRSGLRRNRLIWGSKFDLPGKWEDWFLIVLWQSLAGHLGLLESSVVDFWESLKPLTLLANVCMDHHTSVFFGGGFIAVNEFSVFWVFKLVKYYSSIQEYSNN